MRLSSAVVMLWCLTIASSSTSAGSAASGLVPDQSEAAGIVLGIEGTSFTINGKKTFLLGASYYGALGAPDDVIARDLDDLKTLGFNWIRVWAVWDAFDNNNGSPSPVERFPAGKRRSFDMRPSQGRLMDQLDAVERQFLKHAASCVQVEPSRVIFDTDMDGDNDDVAAAAILNALADSGKVDILAMGVVSRCPYSPACLDAINTYYGRGDIPVGVYKGTTLVQRGSSYAQKVAERCANDIGLSSEVPDVVGVYRRVLSGQSDGAVTMIAVGQMNNLVDLLASPPDRHSDLAGRDLVRRKVATLFVMAPYFNERNEYQRAYNFVTSPKAAVELIAQWPTKIKFGEGNLGHRHFIGSRLSETPADNPSRIAFEAYFAGTTENKRHCADPTTVLYAVCGTQYFGEVGPGACDVREDGYTRWNAACDKQHFYNTQKLPARELEQVMEQLLVKPPELQRRREVSSGKITPD